MKNALTAKIITETEQRLRDIIEAYTTPRPGYEMLRLLEQALNRATAHLNGLDACQFETENGAKCGDKYVRDSRGLLCCEHHANIRDWSCR